MYLSASSPYLDTVLSGLGLLLSSDTRDERDVTETEVFSPCLSAELLQGLQIHCTLDVSNCAADFNQTHVGRDAMRIDRSLGHSTYPSLHGICHLRNDLQTDTDGRRQIRDTQKQTPPVLRTVRTVGLTFTQVGTRRDTPAIEREIERNEETDTDTDTNARTDMLD